MPAFNLTDRIEAAMRYIYGHFLEGGESLAAFMKSRAGVRPQVRHIARYLMYTRFHCTLRQIHQAERRFDGSTEKPDHSTISHSIKQAEQKKQTRAFREIEQLFEEAREYWEEMHEPGLLDKMRYLNKVNKYVLVTVL